jgi:phosphoribosyl 1,2-cyclic phosphodiesterase
VSIELIFWGVRGSTPVSGKPWEKVGGQTSCVSVLLDQKYLIVFDAGSGLYDFGRWLQTQNFYTIHLLFSHLHLDHLIGLPFLEPLWDTRYKINLYSAHSTLKNFLETHLFHHPLFPVPMPPTGAELIFHTITVGSSFKLSEDVICQTHLLNHPGGAVGYRLESDGKSICYITDVEHPPQGLDPGILKFIEGADLFIYDSMYTEEEYQKKRGWGHSTHIQGAKLAQAAKVKQLALFHHEPLHDDKIIAQIEREAQAIFPNSMAAKQGMKVLI